MVGLIARIIAAIKNEPVKPPVHRCPYCFSRDLKVLGSNAARFNGCVSMVFTCLNCNEDSMYNIFRSGPVLDELQPCPKQARSVCHAKAEIWKEQAESDEFPQTNR